MLKSYLHSSKCRLTRMGLKFISNSIYESKSVFVYADDRVLSQ